MDDSTSVLEVPTLELHIRITATCVLGVCACVCSCTCKYTVQVKRITMKILWHVILITILVFIDQLQCLLEWL